MGVPSFFRWLKGHYPLLLSQCIEMEDDEDPSEPNPNTVGDTEFDNLYLDMNGLIHPCYHPANEEHPKTYLEVFQNVEKYVDRIFNLVRPRKVLFMAVDGVAPRAKMNQQRIRRFCAAKDAQYQRYVEFQDIMLSDAEKEAILNEDAIKQADTNTITPGTEFMMQLSNYIKKMIIRKQNESKAWSQIAVIFSDASISGEGEHKIMEFIRSQRIEFNYDFSRRHVVYGLDADFLFLGLSCHELFFTVLREEVFGVENLRAPLGRFGPARFLFANGFVFRQYLEKDLKPSKLNFDWYFERALDDIIFLCVSAGNDFLPQIPGMSITSGSVAKIFENYKNHINDIGGYITDNGRIDSKRAAKFLNLLSKEEDRSLEGIMNPSNLSKEASFKTNKIYNNDYSNIYAKIKVEDEEEHKPDPFDDLKTRYYKEKHGFDIKDEEKVKKVAVDYLKGMAWTLQYYLHGCPSWQWHYPHYYAPLLSSFSLLEDEEIDISSFDDSKPVSPLEQLMSVLPPQSSHLLPKQMAELMMPGSPLEEFYPTNFTVDMMGGHQPWKGVTFIPFIDGDKLSNVLKETKIVLTPEEEKRNQFGKIMIYCNSLSEGFADGPLVWGELKKDEEGGFVYSFENPPREKNLSFIPLNVEQPRNIVSGFATNPEDMPLSIPGIPYHCKRDFRLIKMEKEAKRKSSLAVNKKRKNLSHLL